MTTVTQGNTGTYTFAAGEQVTVTLDPSELARITVTSSTGTVKYSASASGTENIGPFVAGDVFSISAIKGDVDYTISVSASSPGAFTGVTYDGSNRVTSYVSGGITYTVAYPSSVLMTITGGGVIRTIVLDGSGRIVSAI